MAKFCSLVYLVLKKYFSTYVESNSLAVWNNEFLLTLIREITLPLVSFIL